MEANLDAFKVTRRSTSSTHDPIGKSKRILEILEHYYPDPQVPPATPSTYRLLIAVLLSAQCTDRTRQ